MNLSLGASYGSAFDDDLAQAVENASKVGVLTHATNSANTVMLLCADQIGMNAKDFFTPIHLTAIASDFYYGGAGDMLSGITISPLGEQYLGVFASSNTTTSTLATNVNDRLQVLNFGALTNNTETGLLLLFRKGATLGNEAGLYGAAYLPWE